MIGPIRPEELGDALMTEADDLAGMMTDWRRELHQFPEIGMEEHMTASRIVNALSGVHGVEVWRGRGLPTSVIVRVGGGAPGKALGWRVEMDAVEVTEDTGLPFSSYNEGVSHVQGHDAHIAAALGAIRLTAERADELLRPVVYIFQPGEEGRGGARLMLDAGVLDDMDIGRMLCLHWMPTMAYGQLYVRSGAVSAMSSKVHIGITGEGGHGSTPHLTSDPVYLGAQVMTALQGVITREVSASRTAVLSFGRVEAGEAYNVIAGEMHLWGTLRTGDRETMDYLRGRIEEIVRGMARLAHLSVSVEYMLNYDQVINDAALTSEVERTTADVFGADVIETLREPLMTGEDFSFYAERIPCCLMFLGTGMEYGLYHARYDVPESLFPFAAAVQACASLMLDREGDEVD